MKQLGAVFFFCVMVFMGLVLSGRVHIFRCHQMYDLVGCEIRASAGSHVQRLPGSFCVPLPDGSFISAADSRQRLVRYSASGQEVWSQPFLIHEQIHLASGGGELLAIASEVQTAKNVSIRFDKFVVLNLDGRTLREFHTFQHIDEIQNMSANKAFPLAVSLAEGRGVDGEFTHANSIYEIPPNPLDAKMPAFAAGNYLVTLNGKGLLAILSHDMTSILWFNKFDILNGGFFDAQILPSAELLIYGAHVGEDQHSRLAVIDPLTGQEHWHFERQPTTKFRNDEGGRVQRMADGNTVFIDNTKGGRVITIDPDGNELWHYDLGVDPKTGETYEISSLRRLDLTEFFRHNLMPR